MHYRLLCVGRRARDPLLDAAEEYLERLSRYVKVDLVRVRDADLTRERDALLGRLKPTDHVVVLDEAGEEHTTTTLAQRLQRLQTRGRDLVFILGGADGLHDDIRGRANETLSLSRLTLPHRLALVLLLEQLYRAQTLLRGERYHRGTPGEGSRK